MNTVAIIHLVISAVLAILIFREGQDEPFSIRVLQSVVIAAFWLPLLILAAAFIAAVWISAELRALRR